VSELTVERHGPVAELWLNRPQVLNALSTPLQDQIISAVADLDADPEIGVLLLAGHGRAFAAGWDRKEIAQLGSASADQLQASFARGERLVRSILESRLTVVLAAHGYVVGGGVSLVLAADVCLAAEGTQFFIPEVELGMPLLWQSTPLLMASVGIHRARALIATGDRFDAQQAQQMGLVHQVLPPDQFIHEGRRLAERLAAKPRRALEAQKRLTRRAIGRLIADSEVEYARLMANS